MHSKTPPASATVTIAGGGIAGMAAALALSRAGWQASVYEQAPAFSEVGAGVQLGPNVTRVLREWGVLDALMAHASTPPTLNARCARTGEVLARLDLQAVSSRYDAPYVTVHRANLHQVLWQAALAQGAQVHANAVVQSFQHAEDRVRALVQQGDTAYTCDADRAVVADGVWSRLRQQLMADGPVQPNGHLAYRALLRQAELPAALRSDDVTVWMGAQVHVVHYPVQNGEALNVVVLTEGQLSPDAAHDVQSWNAQQSPAQTTRDLQAALGGACSALQAYLQAPPAWRVWPLCVRRPMQSAAEQAQGRIALIGDAAHPMLPYLAQGAGMAIEDAAALAQCPNGDDLGRFAQARWSRNARAQRQAMRHGMIFHAQGPLRWGRDWALRLAGPVLMDQAWLYGAS